MFAMHHLRVSNSWYQPIFQVQFKYKSLREAFISTSRLKASPGSRSGYDVEEIIWKV